MNKKNIDNLDRMEMEMDRYNRQQTKSINYQKKLERRKKIIIRELSNLTFKDSMGVDTGSIVFRPTMACRDGFRSYSKLLITYGQSLSLIELLFKPQLRPIIDEKPKNQLRTYAVMDVILDFKGDYTDIGSLSLEQFQYLKKIFPELSVTQLSEDDCNDGLALGNVIPAVQTIKSGIGKFLRLNIPACSYSETADKILTKGEDDGKTSNKKDT
jgi:hypothetical protein